MAILALLWAVQGQGVGLCAHHFGAGGVVRILQHDYNVSYVASADPSPPSKVDRGEVRAFLMLCRTLESRPLVDILPVTEFRRDMLRCKLRASSPMMLNRATSTPLRDMYQRCDTNMPTATATTTPATTSGTEIAAACATR
mmetsp:Transcript_28304/g.74278  ORF Transcript_28304/g.74278 Transcript_28304/m.74278 type:complete len:141 (-) Transcript_28304:1071-1493(-)